MIDPGARCGVGAPITGVLFDTAASFARERFDALVDTVFERHECCEICLSRLDPLPLLLARVECPAGVLAERERARGDRRPGLAARERDVRPPFGELGVAPTSTADPESGFDSVWDSAHAGS